MYRQGDLLFVMGIIKHDAKEQKDGVLALGEATGHRHRIEDRLNAMMMVIGTMAYVRAIQEANIVHEEHATITLPPGDWEVIKQREYHPDGWFHVLD
jgi:hypothetical protein